MVCCMDLDAVDWQGTPLHHARGKAEVHMLVNAGANIEARDRFGAIPLKMPYVDVDAMRALVNHDANVNAQCNDGFTHLHHAFAHVQFPIVKQMPLPARGQGIQDSNVIEMVDLF